MPCAATSPSVPRMVHMPRFEARTTIGEMDISSARLRYVKHSMSSMCACGVGVSGFDYNALIQLCLTGSWVTHLVNEENARHKLRYSLVDVLADDLVDFAP